MWVGFDPPARQAFEFLVGSPRRIFPGIVQVVPRNSVEICAVSSGRGNNAAGPKRRHCRDKPYANSETRNNLPKRRDRVLSAPPRPLGDSTDSRASVRHRESPRRRTDRSVVGPPDAASPHDTRHTMRLYPDGRHSMRNAFWFSMPMNRRPASNPSLGSR